jgi:hypothetical protein
MKHRLIRGALAGMLAIGSLAGIACDKEDVKDVKEGVNQVKKGAKDVGKDIENGIDNNVDTDGKDD